MRNRGRRRRIIRIEIGTLRQRIRHRSFRGIVFAEADLERLVEHFRPAFFRGAGNQKEKNRIRALLMDPSRKVELPDFLWSGFFLQSVPYHQKGPQDPAEVMIRVKVDMKTPLDEYRVQLKRALNTIFYEKTLQDEVFDFILTERKAFRKRSQALWSEQSFYDGWFRYIFDVREDELQAVLTSGPRGREKWRKHLPTATPYRTRLPDHAIVAITLRLLDEIGCAPDDPDTFKVRLDRWKRQASAR